MIQAIRFFVIAILPVYLFLFVSAVVDGRGIVLPAERQMYQSHARLYYIFFQCLKQIRAYVCLTTVFLTQVSASPFSWVSQLLLYSFWVMETDYQVT